MASYNPGEILSFQTAADLSGSAYCAVELNSSGKVVLLANGNSPALGILTDDVADGSSTEATVSVQVSGVAKMKAGATVTLGTHKTVMPTTGGEATPGTTGNWVVGVPLRAAADNTVIEVLIDRSQLN